MFIWHSKAAAHPFAQRLSQSPDSRLLRADQNTGAELMCMPEVEEQTEHYLAICERPGMHAN